jgi:hypothetical protein
MYRYNNRNCNCNNNFVNSYNTNQSINVNSESSCGFSSQNIFPTNYMYGQSYVPIQYIDKTFTPEEGLRNGSMFPELVSPYNPSDSIRENQFLRRES